MYVYIYTIVYAHVYGHVYVYVYTYNNMKYNIIYICGVMYIYVSLAGPQSEGLCTRRCHRWTSPRSSQARVGFWGYVVVQLNLKDT